MPCAGFFIRVCICLCLIVLAESSFALAQTTIFNAPSTDVVDRKMFYLETDFITNFKPLKKDGFQLYGYRTVYGLRKNMEAGLNFYYSRYGDGTVKEIQPTFKIKTYNNEKYQIGMSTGVTASIPLNRVTSARPFGLFYSNVSKIVNQTGGTRLTGGLYSVVVGSADFGTRFGTIVGVEQPIKGKLSFSADWYSGKNQFGFSAAGLNYQITKRQFLFAGYNFSNTTGADNAFSAFYGITF